jgi:hypothetical protein
MPTRHTTTGVFRYSPTIRGDSTTRRDGGSTVWWLILDCDPELGRLLRHFYRMSRCNTVTPQPPLWGTHVSVIRGEEPPVKRRWGEHAGVEVAIAYEPEVRETNSYLWVPAWCPLALEHRSELGLPPEPDPPLHLTFGNLKG